MDKSPLFKAVEIAGGQLALAKLLGVNQPRIWNWLHRDKVAPPAEQVIPIETATGVPRYELRPDLYPRIEQDDPPSAKFHH